MSDDVIVLSFRRGMKSAEANPRPCWLASQPVGRWVIQAHLAYAPWRPTMLRLTRLPEEVTRLLAPLKPSSSYRHYLVLCWLLVAHLVCYEKATLQALARYIPGHVAAWHLRRWVAAGCWQWAGVLEWLVSQALTAFPPPKYGVLYLVVDSTLKGKRRVYQKTGELGRLLQLHLFTSHSGSAGTFEQKVTVSGLLIMMPLSLVNCSALQLR